MLTSAIDPVTQAHAAYREWREKYLQQDYPHSETGLAELDKVVAWFIDNSMPRLIETPEHPLVKAILVNPFDYYVYESSHSRFAPIHGNNFHIIALGKNGEIADFNIAPGKFLAQRIDDRALETIAARALSRVLVQDGKLYYGPQLSRYKDLLDISELADGRMNTQNIMHMLRENHICVNGIGYEEPPKNFERLVPYLEHYELAVQLKQAVHNAARQAFRRFHAQLNEKAKECAAGVERKLSVALYKYLSPEGALGERRRQAVRMFPFLVDVIYDDHDNQLQLKMVGGSARGKDKNTYCDLDELMEEKDSMRAVGAALDLPDPIMKRLIGLHTLRMESLSSSNLLCDLSLGVEHVLHFLSCLRDYNMIPYARKEPEKLQALLKVIAACAEIDVDNIADRFKHAPQENYAPRWLANLIGTLHGDMAALIEKHEKSGVSLFTVSANVRDYVNAVAEVLVLPEIARRLTSSYQPGKSAEIATETLKRVRHTLLETLFAGHTFEQVLDLSARWHRRQVALDNTIRTEERAGSWGKLIEDTPVPLDIAPQGVTITALNTAELLNAEGYRMGNCVGGASNRCIRETLHVLSMRDKDGNSLSTPGVYEVEEVKNGERFVSLRLDQHEGPNHTEPPPHLVNAMEWLMASIHKGDIRVDFPAMECARKVAGESKHSLNNTIGFDPRDAARCAIAFDEYRKGGLLPKHYVTLESFLEESGLNEAITHALGNTRQEQRGR